MVSNIIKSWVPDVIKLTSTSKPTKIVEIHGGQSVIIKSIGTAGEYFELFPSNNITVGKGFRLFPKENVTFTLPKSFGETNILEVWGLPLTANDEVTIAKIINTFPDLEPSASLG